MSATHGMAGPHTVTCDPVREIWICDGCGRIFTSEWMVRMGLLGEWKVFKL